MLMFGSPQGVRVLREGIFWVLFLGWASLSQNGMFQRIDLAAARYRNIGIFHRLLRCGIDLRSVLTIQLVLRPCTSIPAPKGICLGRIRLALPASSFSLSGILGCSLREILLRSTVAPKGIVRALTAAALYW